MKSVNEEVRTQVRATMRDKGITQQDLADQLGVNRVYVNRMLNGAASQIPVRWAEMLNLLGLELTVRAADKGADDDSRTVRN